MAIQDDRRAGDETEQVEVTPEMIEAGVDALYDEINGWDEATNRVRHRASAAAFLAMLDAAYKLSGRRLILRVDCQSLLSM